MSEQSNRVLVDMDNTLVDFDSAALVNIPKELRVPKNNFYAPLDYPVELRPSIENVYNTPGFFEGLVPIPGMFEAWQAMIDHGYEPQVASSPLGSNPTAIEGKIKWLDRHMVPEFGVSVVEDAIIDKAKWKYRGLALIDDRPSVTRGPEGLDKAEWEHILFGWAHLSSVPMATAAFRLIDWHDRNLLISMLDTIKEQG